MASPHISFTTNAIPSEPSHDVEVEKSYWIKSDAKLRAIQKAVPKINNLLVQASAAYRNPRKGTMLCPWVSEATVDAFEVDACGMQAYHYVVAEKSSRRRADGFARRLGQSQAELDAEVNLLEEIYDTIYEVLDESASGAASQVARKYIDLLQATPQEPVTDADDVPCAPHPYYDAIAKPYAAWNTEHTAWFRPQTGFATASQSHPTADADSDDESDSDDDPRAANKPAADKDLNEAVPSTVTFIQNGARFRVMSEDAMLDDPETSDLAFQDEIDKLTKALDKVAHALGDPDEFGGRSSRTELTAIFNAARRPTAFNVSNSESGNLLSSLITVGGRKWTELQSILSILVDSKRAHSARILKYSWADLEGSDTVSKRTGRAPSLHIPTVPSLLATGLCKSVYGISKSLCSVRIRSLPGGR
ncbi:hypothetical protein C8F01DRAFT_1257151 [Mycena amicta]|nr:hypothetical protein C8F01DRAFT_1257151 [Mycena amicta]